jgi:hypothetical protein
MRKTGVVLVLVLGLAATAEAQTSADLGAKYRQIISYELRPGVVMTPRYAPNGQVCEMVVEKRAQNEAGIVFGFSFSDEERQQVVDQIVSPHERGKDDTDRLSTTVDGGFITSNYTYDNVKIRVQGVTRPNPNPALVITITWRKRNCADTSADQAPVR